VITTPFRWLVIFIASAGLCSAEPVPRGSALNDSRLFEATKIWDIHLTFTPEQWTAMEPVEGPRPQRRQNSAFLQGPEGGRNGIAAAFGWQFNHAKADLDFGSEHLTEVGVRVKGNGTFLTARESLKRSLKLDFNHFVKGQKMAGLTQLNLHNSVRDPSNTNESIAYRIFSDCGVPAPRTSFAKVYVSVPGTYEHKYFGLYDVVEDVGAPFTAKHFGSKEGALLKPVTPQLFADLGDDWKDYNQTYDPKGNLSEDQKKRIIQTCKFFSSIGDAEFAENVGDYIDLENLARYLAITVWMTDLDGILGPGQNYYIYLHPGTGKFMFIPWDQDQGFGQFPRGTQEQRETLSIAKPWTGNNRFLDRLFKVEAFQTNYRKFLKEFNEKQLSANTLVPQIDALAAVLRDAISEESGARLAAFQKATAGEAYLLEMGPGYREPVTILPLKHFAAARGKSIDDQLAGRSQGVTFNR